MGSCFLSFLEAQSKLLTSVSEIMSPLGAYRELGKGLTDTLSTSCVKDATVGWLAAAQVRRKEGWTEGRGRKKGEGGRRRRRQGKEREMKEETGIRLRERERTQ